MRKKTWLPLAALLGLSGAVSAQQPAANPAATSIIPQPVRLTAGRGSFAVTKATKIFVDPKNEELRRIGEALSQDIKRTSGVQPQVVATPAKASAGSIRLTLRPALDTLGAEGYTLSVQPAQVVLAAGNAQGVFRGLQTIRQLLPTQRTTAVSLPAVEVADKPRYQWRGMHLDVSRHFFGVEFVKKYIDYLALHKMNTFHWHLTDDQGWRIEIKKYPKLTSVGGWRDGTLIGHYTDQPHQFDNIRYGGFYTQEQIREVVKYAQERYITVVPEIEMPGHAVAALAGYPELSCTGGPFKVERLWGVFDDIFCAGNEQTFTFLQDVLTEVMPLFPGKIVHIGGDEAPKTRWHSCPKCQARMKAEGLKDEHELQSYFVQRMEKFVNSKGKSIIGWDEILEGGLAPNAAVMSWRGQEGGTTAARQQHNVVMTPGSHSYFDHYQGLPELEPLAFGGYLPLSKVYTFEPTPKELTAAEQRYILGGQANIWTEYIPTEQQVEYMAFPRMSALAEALWSPARLRNWPDFQQRMRQQYRRYEAWGANYARSAFNVRQQLTLDPAQRTTLVTLQMDAAGPQIRYTLDGSAPTASSPVYTQPFLVSSSAVIKAASFEDGKLAGKVSTRELLVHKAFATPVTLANEPNKIYTGSGPFTLVNGQKGSTNHADGQWLGFYGTDLVATLDLQKPTEINTVTSTFLRAVGSGIQLPTSVEVAVSEDGKTYRPVYSAPVPVPAAQVKPAVSEVRADLKKTTARFVRVTAKNAQAPGAAKPNTWLFVDEIAVQ
ncbi:glycoside hydrolase family 20 protein [Hymenobacter endophyticus]|uniref:beta-N-acetylhexosaminidase n=1 Tax=Hymenobacter endophyticus TaxID=3076335 RepID=A0ABU3TN93_9BACT|nr:glycoside hydrolase family 20 protein [Hymenobacter endophyticus]MDU0372847.1 glycoside hydrolase family 20 protein [Hymenobacter endophyticus]